MSASELIDLRSDAVTQPTEQMWRAMRAAPAHWSADGADPSVLALEARASELSGKPAALFVPTGTMGNLVALMAQVQRGEHVIVDAQSHIYRSEEWGYAYICGAAALPLSSRGVPEPPQLHDALTERLFSHRPRTALLCLENTANAAGGAAATPAQCAALAEVAHAHGASVHLDGARLWNAAVALGVEPRELAAPADTVMLGLAKGLSAPGGALLCGPEPVIALARGHLKRLGAHSLPNNGILAAAALVALDTMLPRLAEDHRRARLLADGLAGLSGLALDVAAVQTNIVLVRVRAAHTSAAALVERLAQHGVLALTLDDSTVRLVTHRHIDDNMCARAVAAFRDALAAGASA